MSKDAQKSTETKLVVQGETTLWQVDLNSAKIEPYRETYTFTVGELGSKGLLPSDVSGTMNISASNFWRDDVSDNIKNSFIDIPDLPAAIKKYNITCSDPDYTEGSFGNIPSKGYLFLVNSTTYDIAIAIINENDEQINNDNYQPYADLAFTISMPE